MSSRTVTKRRKTYCRDGADGFPLVTALRRKGQYLMVEHRPGDVILSRKNVDRLRRIIDDTLGVSNIELCIEAFKLLRGSP